MIQSVLLLCVAINWTRAINFARSNKHRNDIFCAHYFLLTHVIVLNAMVFEIIHDKQLFGKHG